MHAEELADQDRQQVRCAADAAGEDSRQPLDRLDRRLVVDEQGRGPVAARHDAGQVHHQTEIDAAEVDGVDMAGIDTHAGPGLASVFRRRMFAQRQHARTEHRATARQCHLAFQRPALGHVSIPFIFPIVS
jgi:hypothetical protein